jgi:hypothetical protein
MSIIGSNILAGASGQGGGYTIENSLRFRSSASAYLNRTPATAGNQQRFTWSGWVKRGALTGSGTILGAYSGGTQSQTNAFDFRLSGDYLDANWGNGTWFTTTAAYRDPSAWYHIVLAVDTTQATASSRMILYVNGALVTAFSAAAYPTQNTNLIINTTTNHTIGKNATASANYFDGYLTEVNFIDGQALDASSFGEYNEDTGVWQPKKYSGSYGTNGFYLPFSDNTTTTTLAADSSGNGNDWTPNNISLTSGVTYDSMTDTPTPYEDGGNYAVLNPLNKAPAANLSNANLTSDFTTTLSGCVAATIGSSSGKFYYEVTVVNPASLDIGLVGANFFGGSGGTIANGIAYYAAGQVQRTDTLIASGLATFTGGDVIGVAFDCDANQVSWYKNGSAVTTQSINLTAPFFPAIGDWSTNSGNTAGAHTNFGQRPFAYTPPTGFLPLHTGNLPDSAIVDGSEYFNTVLYTGDGTLSNSITGVGFAPDWLWLKSRSGAYNHQLYDVIRGDNNSLRTNSTNAESTLNVSLDSDGFTLGDSSNNINGSGVTYAAWNWKANGAGVSNTDGSITSTVSANTTSGVSIVTYTGTGSVATVGHGLGVAPNMVIVKKRSDVSAWLVYHSANTSAPATDYLELNTTSATVDNATVWNDTEPTSSVFSIGTAGAVNANTATYVAYCFADVEGYSKFGSYTGNNSSTDGTFVFLGFRPRFLMIKSTSASTEWVMVDTERSQYNLSDTALYANRAYSESTVSTVNDIDILSNGFKLRNNTGYVNASQTYIYAAFAEHPFKHSLAR